MLRLLGAIFLSSFSGANTAFCRECVQNKGLRLLTKNHAGSCLPQIHNVVPAYYNETIQLDLKRARLLVFDLIVKDKSTGSETIRRMAFCPIESLVESTKGDHCIAFEPCVCAASMRRDVCLQTGPLFGGTAVL
jgi:hypothetical protein